MEFLNAIAYYPFINLLIFFTWLIPGHNAAWGIILLTLLVRFILLIPSRKATEAQRKMNALNPLIEELKKKHAGDQQGLAKAQMQLYKDNNINPLGSCLPSLIQLPFLWILYKAILHGFDVSSPYLYSWLPTPDFINTSLFGIDLLKPDRFFVLPILAAALQFVSMYMMLPPKAKGDSQEAQMANMQRNMLFIFPFMTLFITLKLPAGAALYWVVTTLFSIVQQYFVLRERLKIKGLDTLEKMSHEEGKAFDKDLAKLEGHTESSSTGSNSPVKAEKIIKESTEKKGVKVVVRKKSS